MPVQMLGVFFAVGFLAGAAVAFLAWWWSHPEDF